MDKPNSKSLDIVIPGYRMHTQMFDNMLDGFTEEAGLQRVEDKTNHAVWMLGNLVNCRYWLANIFGMESQDPNEHLFKDAKALDPEATYPTLSELKEEWHKISPLLYQKLLEVDDNELSEMVEFGMGVAYVEENKLNMVGMGIDRESYLFGQLGLMRKILGFEGVKYDIDPALNY